MLMTQGKHTFSELICTTLINFMTGIKSFLWPQKGGNFIQRFVGEAKGTVAHNGRNLTLYPKQEADTNTC